MDPLEFFEQQPTKVDIQLANLLLTDTPLEGGEYAAQAISLQIEEDETNGINYGDFW